MTEKKQDILTLIILLLVASLAYLPFVYQGTLGEWDSYRMANDLVHSLTSGTPFKSPLLYNLDASFGYYALLYLLTPAFKANWTLVITCMNYLNAVSAILMVIPLFLVVRRHWGTTTAVLANVLLIFVPSWWNVALYGHPMVLAMLCMFTGLALMAHRSQMESLKAAPGRLIALDILTILMFSLSLAFRFDAILMFPLISACLLLERHTLKTVVLRSLLYGLLPPLIVSAMRSIVLDTSLAAAFLSPIQRLSGTTEYQQLRLSPMELLRSLTLWALACHPVYLLAFAVSSVLTWLKRDYLTLFFVLPVFILNLLFWAPNPSPARHFVYMAPLLALGVATWLSHIARRTAVRVKYSLVLAPVPIAILFIIVSFVSSELMYPLVRTYYPWKGAPQNYSARAPIRSIFINKYYTENYFHTAASLGQDLRQLEPMDRPIMVIADALPLLLDLQMFSKQTRVEGEDLCIASGCAIIYHVQDARNKFVLVAETEGGDWPQWLQTIAGPVEYYLVIDRHSTNGGAVDTRLLDSRFSVLPLSR